MLDFQEKFLIFFLHISIVMCEVESTNYPSSVLGVGIVPLWLRNLITSPGSLIITSITPLLKTKEPLQRLNRELDMNIFGKLKMYASKWSETECRNFTPEEIAAVERAEIVASQYGNSVCFFMVGGGQCYIPLDRDSTLGVGESVDLQAAKLKTLSKQGEDDIMRVSI